MFKNGLIAAATLFVCSTALAEAAPRHERQETAKYRAQRLSVEPSAPRALAQSPSQCVPDQGVPVWGGRSALLGYACINPSGN